MGNEKIMEELIQEFRIWNMDWMTYSGFTKKYGKPKSIKEFCKELCTKYKIEKLNE